jgi:carbon-monoxide dehydrogenase medium subunit
MGQTFHQPASVDEAIAVLTEHGELARLLAGGATLVAMMNAGLLETSALISLSAIEELTEIRIAEDGSARIGAMRRHRQTAFESNLRDGQQVLSRAAAQIANVPVRNMGTLGGSISFADPAADYPPALVAADARIEIAGKSARRQVAAEEFFLGWYETALESGEMVTAAVVPEAPAGSVGVYEKLCRVSGDFAVASVALRLTANAGEIADLRIAIGACGGGPVRVPEAEKLLIGFELTTGRVEAAAECIVAELDPVDDVRASAAYRRLVVPRLLQKALTEAVHEANGQ